MRASLLLTASAFITTTALAANNTFESYAPIVGSCPSGLELYRSANGLSTQEAQWVAGRKKVAAAAFSKYLERLELQDFDVQNYTKLIMADPMQNMPTIGFGVSGGGYRSSITGGCGWRTFDALLPAAVKQKTGGLLQSATYMSGLSGGSWPTTSIVTHNFPALSVDEILDSWYVNVTRIAQTANAHRASLQTMYQEIGAKWAAGFNVSISDLLGLSFGYEFIPGPRGGLNVTFSGIPELSNFQKHMMPMPILQTSSIAKENPSLFGLYIPLNTSIHYEWNPWEFGSWTVGFTPTKYVGTTNTSLAAGKCVTALDRMSFVLGTAAAAWNFWWIGALSNGTLGDFSKRYAPSLPLSANHLSRRQVFPISYLEGLDAPFKKYFNLSLPQIANPSIPTALSADNITLADQSEAGSSLPVWPQVQPARKSDFLVLWDDDNDAQPYGWTNGTNMYFASLLTKQAGLAFPMAPPPTTFLARNYTHKPVLFGCNTSLTNNGPSDPGPIVLYLANSPYTAYTNYSWFDNTIPTARLADVKVNSFNLITQGNGTIPGGADWTSCIGCAAIDRSLARLGIPRTQQCEQCFANWCWDGTESTSNEPYVGGYQLFDPTMTLKPGVSYAAWNKTHPFQ